MLSGTIRRDADFGPADFGIRRHAIQAVPNCTKGTGFEMKRRTNRIFTWEAAKPEREAGASQRQAADRRMPITWDFSYFPHSSN